MDRIRLGILGAARIAPVAVVRPARRVEQVEVVAIAAREPDRARRFAKRHGVPRVVPSYQDLIEDPEVDALYIPLPNGLHGRWTLAALAAGKPVLCEKPFTANAVEAQQVAEAAARAGVVVMEAFHYRYHPLFARMLDVVHSGELGELRHIETAMCFPLPLPRDIRWQLELAGGAAMDVGCYAVHMLRHLAGAEPEVSAARAKLLKPGVDRMLQAEVTLPGGVTGRWTASLLSAKVLSMVARVQGTRGTMHVRNPTQPALYHAMVVRAGGRRRVEHAVRRPTYEFQLAAFANAVLRGASIPTGPDDAVANMRVIDAAYRAAGLEPRQPTP